MVPASKTYAPGGNSTHDKSNNAVGPAPANHRAQEHLMLDVIMLALGLGFFVLAVGYTYACERL